MPTTSPAAPSWPPRAPRSWPRTAPASRCRTDPSTQASPSSSRRASSCGPSPTPGPHAGPPRLPARRDGAPEALFSGGSLMVGAVGRTDLLGDERREELARDLFRALRSEILTLPDDLPVYPTHGAGRSARRRRVRPGPPRSATSGPPTRCCRSTTRTASSSALLDGLGSFPRYFRAAPGDQPARSPPLPERPRASPRLDVDTVRSQPRGRRRARRCPARSTPSRTAHPRGAISIEHRPVFASWLGWLVALDRPVVFVLDDTTDRADLVRQCLTVGHEAILGELDGGIAAWADAGLPVASIPLVEPADDGRDGARCPPGLGMGGRSPPRRDPRRARRRSTDATLPGAPGDGHVRPR